ncbi:MAG: hypothetical protein ACI84E_002623, partial [Planctomycetota bacterium]
NTVGAIIGAVLAGFLLIPNLGFAGSIHAAVATNLALALVTALIFLPSSKFALVGAAVALAGGLFGFQPEIPEQLLRHSSFGLPADGKILHMAVGRSATVLAIEQDGYYEIRSNGLPEALVTPKGAPPFGTNSPYYLALTPVLARPKAKSMMVIGFGGGVTLEAVPPSIKRVDAIELEPEIIAANEVFSDQRAVNPFKDPRLNLIHNDARGALSLTNEQWDIIVSQPSHPWTAGASHLYTREFLDLIKEHLTTDGVFVQWMNSNFLDEELFGSIGNTLMDAFENVRLYQPIPSMLIFLASDGDLNVEREVARTGLPMSAHPAWWARLGLYDVNDVAAILAVDHAGLVALCADAPICTDDANVLAMRAEPKKARFKNNDVTGFLYPQDPLLHMDSPLSKELEPYLDRYYLALKWANSDLIRRAIESTKILEPNSPLQLRTQGALKASVMLGQWDEGNQDLARAFQADPSDMASRFLLLRDNLPAIAMESEGTGPMRHEASQLGGAAAVVLQAWGHSVNGRYEALENMESDLAKARPRDPWFIEATRLRCHWRLRLDGSDQEHRQRAVETLRIIDTALVFEPNPFLLLQRVTAAQKAGRPRYIVETLNSLADFVGPRASTLPLGITHSLARELTRHAPTLAAMRNEASSIDWRVSQVQQYIAEVLVIHQARMDQARVEYTAKMKAEAEKKAAR